METETSDSLPFFDVLISKQVDGLLGHSVYRKSTHTHRQLPKARSLHPPLVKSSVNRTLHRRAHTISDKEHLPSELKHLNAVLRDNGYIPDKLRFLPNRNAPRSSDKPDKGDRHKYFNWHAAVCRGAHRRHRTAPQSQNTNNASIFKRLPHTHTVFTQTKNKRNSKY